MEMEAEHYPNGVLESMSTRIVNGAYKHEDLQTDESSMGKAVPSPAHWSTGDRAQSRCPLPSVGVGVGLGRLIHCLCSYHKWVFAMGGPWPAAQARLPH